MASAMLSFAAVAGRPAASTMGVYRRGRERTTYPWTDDPPQPATIESPGLEAGEGVFAWSAETGVGAVVLLVELRKFAVAVRGADGGAGAVGGG